MADNPTLWLRKALVVSPEAVQVTVNATTGQRTNAMWSVVRKLRITASNFGVVLAAAKRSRYVKIV
jgi:hypothetical protein